MVVVACASAELSSPAVPNPTLTPAKVDVLRKLRRDITGGESSLLVIVAFPFVESGPQSDATFNP
jgi:hypothetical protein